jgi:uncharacterized protein YndB with AHSA1/START domain
MQTEQAPSAPPQPQSPPVLKSTTVALAPHEAFEFFTARPLRWWPDRHRLVAGERAGMVIEPAVGGRWYEEDRDGARAEWGTVLVWDPPRRLTLTWRISGRWRPLPDDTGASEIEVGFAPAQDGAGTLVTVAHTHLERYGADAAGMRAALDAPRLGETLSAFAAAVAEAASDAPADSGANA